MLMMVMTYSFIFTIPSALFQFGILFKADFWRYVLLISPTQASTYVIESGLVKDFKLEAGLSFGILITLTVLGYFFYIYPKYKHYAVKQSGV
jgi:fluoroquinolone transport system permease protein